MDGTWLRDDKTYDQDLFEQILELIEQKQIAFVIASGNQYENLKTRFPKVADKLYFVSENGALVADGDEILHVESVTKQEFETMKKITNTVKNPVVVCGLKSAYVREKDGHAYHVEMEKYFKNLTIVSSFDEIPDDEQIFKISFDTTLEELPGLISQLRNDYPEFEIVAGGPDSIDIQQKGLSKATGLKYLSKYLKIDPSEMIAFGDGENDHGMLNYVGYNYVTSSALPQTKAIADELIGSSNDSAVQKKIIELLTSEN